MKSVWGAGLLLCAATAAAKNKPVALSETDAAALRGKTVALTVHERPSFVAFTAGKATLGLFGTAAMISAGNNIVDDNGIEDPAILVRTQLARALADHYGAVILEPDATPSKAKKPKELTALHPEADYVFDVASVAWSFSYFPSNWDNYWIGYTVQTQLVDTRTGRQLSLMGCGAGTKDHPQPPSHKQMLDNNAQLLKDVTQHLGWTCTQILAKEQYGLQPDKVAAIPARYVDPLTPASDAAAAAPPGETDMSANGPATPGETAHSAAETPAATPAEATGTPAGAAAPPAAATGEGAGPL